MLWNGRSALLVMIALGVVAGCGGESRGVGATPDDRAAAGTVTNWLSALVAGDDARACSYLTPSLRRAIDRHIRIRAERGSCRDWAAKWLGGTKPPGHRDARVTGVRVRDAAATVTVEAAPDLTSEVRLLRLGTGWRIDNY